MAKTSPTQRSLAYLRKIGGFQAIVEKWNPHAMIRQDLFGWIDIIHIDEYVPGYSETGVLGVQTTTQKNAKARLDKARGNKALSAWLRAGNRLVVHGWKKSKGRWVVDCRPVTLADLEMAG